MSCFMTPLVRSLLAVAVVGALWAAAGMGAVQRQGPSAPRDTAQITPEQRAAAVTYDAAVAPADRARVEQVVARALPEARRLIEVVDGLVTVRVGETGSGALGLTTGNHDGYAVTLDLRRTEGSLGERGVQRLVLHELAHVVDHALVDDGTMGRLDAMVPRGYECDTGEATGSCAEVEERFAETFAKWATGDIGVGLYIGYKVPPPDVPLAAWGGPLGALGR